MARSCSDFKRPFAASPSGGFLLLLLLAVSPMLLSPSRAEPPPLSDCSTVTALISTCSQYITYGIPEPMPGTPCCDAMTTMNMIATSEPADGHSVCRCLMDLIAAYNPNASAIAALPGLCGVSLGFTISPTTDCNFF